MHTTTVAKVGTLVPAPYNPREISSTELDNLKQSLRDYGFVVPIAARAEDLLVLGGHQRLEAYKQLLADAGKTAEEIAATDVPVVLVANLDDRQAKALNLALNKIQGEWDYTKLSEVFNDLMIDDSVDLLTGFSKDEVDDIIEMMGIPDPVDVDPAEAERNAAAALAAKGRRFTFEVPTDRDAAMCRRVLTAFGMDGQSSASSAFVSAMKAAQAHPPKKVPPKKPAKKTPAKKPAKKAAAA